jgi:hypothetical protein
VSAIAPVSLRRTIIAALLVADWQITIPLISVETTYV